MRGVGIYVIIKPTEGVLRQTSSGLDIPPSIVDRFIQAKIISASKIAKEEFGLKDGDTVLYDKHAGNEFKGVNNETYRAITCRDIAVVL
jgi:co-chaperonin GroES (HSP10)